MYNFLSHWGCCARFFVGVCIFGVCTCPPSRLLMIAFFLFSFFISFLCSVVLYARDFHISSNTQNYFKKLWNFVEFLSTTGAIIEFILQLTVLKDSDVRM